MAPERHEATHATCRATTKAGHQCAAPAIKGGVFCLLHADPTRAAELGRKGGMGNRHIYEDDGREVAAPRNASDVKDLLAEAMRAIRSGKMNPKRANALGYLGSSLLKAIEVADLEQRLERLEESNGGPASPSQAAGKVR